MALALSPRPLPLAIATVYWGHARTAVPSVPSTGSSLAARGSGRLTHLALAGDLLYIGLRDGQVLAIQTTDGVIRWRASGRQSHLCLAAGAPGSCTSALGTAWCMP